MFAQVSWLFPSSDQTRPYTKSAVFGKNFDSFPLKLIVYTNIQLLMYVLSSNNRFS